jgi:hypothetical protein
MWRQSSGTFQFYSLCSSFLTSGHRTSRSSGLNFYFILWTVWILISIVRPTVLTVVSCGSRHSTSNQATTAFFLTPPDPLRTLLFTSYHSALSFEIYWHCCWMNHKTKHSSFTSNRPAGSGFELRHQFENFITSSSFRVDANETMFISK